MEELLWNEGKIFFRKALQVLPVTFSNFKFNSIQMRFY